jgi:hypothetical protein
VGATVGDGGKRWSDGQGEARKEHQGLGPTEPVVPVFKTELLRCGSLLPLLSAVAHY